MYKGQISIRPRFQYPKRQSVFLLIVPVRSSRLDFAGRLKVPPENQLNPLQQVTRDLDMSDIRQMVLGVNIVVLQKALGGEIVDETTVFEVLIDIPGLFLVVSATDVLLSFLAESSPLRLLKVSWMEHLQTKLLIEKNTYHEEDDRIRPVRVDILYQVDVGMVIIPAGDFIRMAMIVAAHLNDHKIGRLLCFDVPLLGIAVVDGVCARARV